MLKIAWIGLYNLQARDEFSAKSNFPRNLKILAKATLTQRWRNILRHFYMLWLCDVVTMLALLCYKITTRSLFNVSTTFSINVCKFFISRTVLEFLHSVNSFSPCLGLVLKTFIPAFWSSWLFVIWSLFIAI